MRTTAEILQQYGLHPPSTAPGDYATTCPQCSHKRKTQNQKKKCLGIHIDTKSACWRCNHCGWSGPEKGSGNGRGDERVGSTPLRKPAQDHHAGNDTDDTGRIKAALRWWREAGPIEGTLGINYFERERGIRGLPPDTHDVLRFHRRVIFGQDESGAWRSHPCILALLRDAISNEPTGVHRIALDDDGKLIGRMGLGRKQGSVIKLWGDSEITAGLVIGEGLETVLSAALHVHHRGALLQPAWACVDAGNLERFPILPGIEHLTILADADESNRGQSAARTCAKRWAEAGREAVVLIPDQLGHDFNDIAKQQAAAKGLPS